jgi:cytochrome c oxidase cbb3-type subunit 3
MIADSRPTAGSEVPAPNSKHAPEAALLDHEYDGIKEYDNPMPRWWVWMFWGSFYFAICYFLWFQVYRKGSVAEDYEADMRVAREQAAEHDMGAALTEDALEKLMRNAAVMADAKATFTAKCVQCHGQNGIGLIGPNLTDDYWIHGTATLMDIYGVVNEGVPAKGMPTWGKQLARVEVAKLAAYVGTLRGKHLPGKLPEGTLLPAATAASK